MLVMEVTSAVVAIDLFVFGVFEKLYEVMKMEERESLVLMMMMIISGNWPNKAGNSMER